MAALGSTTQFTLANAKAHLACSSSHCDTTEGNWLNKDDDMMICTKAGCRHQYIIYCRVCMTNGHKRIKNHSILEDPARFINIREAKICSRCKLVHSSKRNLELLVCNQEGCEHHSRILCTQCIFAVHGDATRHTFVPMKKWLSLVRMKQIKPHSTLRTLAKGRLMTEIYGTAGIGAAVATLGAEGMAVLSAIPLDATYAQWQQGFALALKESGGGAAVVGNLARSQAVVSGLMFAGECGFYMFQYAYSGSITKEEMIAKCKKSAVANSCGAAGSVICGAIGFMIAGPLGAGLGSCAGGLIGNLGARKYMDSDDSKEYQDKEKKLEKACRQFGFKNGSVSSLIKDTKLFTADELQRRYRMYALHNHPDHLRLSGRYNSEEEMTQIWAEFSSRYMLLLEVCRQRDEQK